MNGHIYSNKGADNQEYLDIAWSCTYNTSNNTATFYITAIIQRTTSKYPNRAYRIVGDASKNYVKINNNTIFSVSANSGNGTKNNPKNAYTNIGCIGAEKVSYFSNWLGGASWVYCHANLNKGYSLTVPLDENGYASFTVSAYLSNYLAEGCWQIVEQTVTTSTPADILSKVSYKQNGTWTRAGGVWYKENGVWTKRRLYHKENGQWVKVL